MLSMMEGIVISRSALSDLVIPCHNVGNDEKRTHVYRWSPPLLTKNRHFEIDVNPYPINGTHSYIVQTKNIDPGPKSGSRGIVDWIAGNLAGCPVAESCLIWFLNLSPGTSSDIVNNALSALVDSNDIDKSYKVLNVGAVIM